MQKACTFLPNVTKIDPYNFELYRFKVGAFFETQCCSIKHQTVWTQTANKHTNKQISEGLYIR